MKEQTLALDKPLPAAESETSRMFAMIERMATDPAVDPQKLKEILSVKQSWEADEARKAFARDMAVFQSRCPIISKADKAYDKMYARIDRIHRETRDLRKECGFWFTWQKCEIHDQMAHMEGVLGHSGGHMVPLKQVIPIPDNAKGMNSTQRAGSAMTYAKRYGECLALDIVTGEDDDGHAAPPPKPVAPNTSELETLKRDLWELTKSVHHGDKKKLRQYLVDDCGLDPERPLEEITVAEAKAVFSVAKSKLK